MLKKMVHSISRISLFAISLMITSAVAQTPPVNQNNKKALPIPAITGEYEATKAQFLSLKDVVERKRQYKKSLEFLATVRFYLPEIIRQTAEVRDQIKFVQEQIKDDKEAVAEYRQEKRDLLAELEKPRQARQPAQKSAIARAWDWATAPKEVAQQPAQERLREQPQEQLTRMQRELNSYRRDIIALRQELAQLDNYISRTRAQLIEAVGPEEWERLENLHRAYGELEKVSQALDKLKDKKWALLRDIEGMEPEAF